MKISTLDKIRCFLSELIGTGLLVFLGCMGCVNTDAWINNHLQMTLNFGLVVMVIIQAFGSISGAHLNPAVTLAALIYKLISIQMAAIYVVAQLLGAFIGYGLLKLLLSEAAIKPTSAAFGLCVTTVHPGLHVMQGFGIEILITAVLAWVCCGVWDSKYHDSVPIRFGLTIACLAITAGPFTGASMNPARSFAPAIWNKETEHQWVYWVAPMIGAGVATFVYKVVFQKNEEQDIKQNNKQRAMEELPLS